MLVIDCCEQSDPQASIKGPHPRECVLQTMDLMMDDPGDCVPAHTRHPGDTLEEASYICSQCGETLNSYSQYTVHEEVHKTVDLYRCRECGLGFNNSTAIMIHQRTHSEKTVYMCMECNQSFIYRNHLIHHQEKFHRANHDIVVMPTNKIPVLDVTRWTLEEKREIMYCYYYASALLPGGYMQLLRSKLEQRAIIPLTKLQCASDGKIRSLIVKVKYRQYINEANLNLLKKAAKKELAGQV